MVKEGNAKELSDGKKIFKDSKGKWHDFSKADMSHKRDAVDWWNNVARKKGYEPKGKEVREWMLKPENYRLDHYSINRSAGGKIKQTYKPPLK